MDTHPPTATRHPGPPHAPQLFHHQRRGTPGATRWVLMGVIVVHTVAACAQPVLAGSYFEGNVDAIVAHGLNGSLLALLCVIQFAAAVLFWRPGRGPGWPALATAALFFAEGFQIGMGYTRALAIHVPLGVAIVTSLLALSVWVVRWRPASVVRQ